MSSSKFANLEGVDFESPDVYETHSPSPTRRSRNLGRSARDHASFSSEEDSDEEGGDGDSDGGFRSNRRGAKKVGGQDTTHGSNNPDIVATGLNPEEASDRFKKATGVDSRSVDFSTAIQKRKKRPQYYPPSTFETTTYELGSGTGYRTSGGGHGPGDEEPWSAVSTVKEKPVDKFRRLRYEMEQLEKELNDEASGSVNLQDDRNSKGGEKNMSSGLLLQLSTLRGQLSSMEDRNLQGSSSSATWNVESRKLLEKLSLKEGGVIGESSKGETRERAQISAEAGGDSTRLAGLDERLAGLEELIGVKDAMVDETKSLPRPLLSSLARIEHLLTLLTHPRHLDGISRRIKVLVSELERLHEARRKLNSVSSTQQQIGDKKANGEADSSLISSSQAVIPLETMQKLETVMPMLSRLEPLLPVVPVLLARLHSLTALHARSNTFVEDVDQLETSLKRSHANSEELKTMLTSLESSFAENEKRVTSNLQVVEDRMESITQRVKRLQG